MKARQTIICLLATLLVTATVASAEDPVNIPDPALKAALKEALGLTTDPTPSDMLRLTDFEPVGRGITDLTGLEHATNLARLDLLDNQISDIGPLQDLAALWWLKLGGNPIKDVTALGNMTSLRELNIERTLVTDITPLASLKSLERFYAMYTPIASLEPLRGLTNLAGLSFYGSESIYDIGPLAGLTRLDYLILAYNHISDISPLSGLTSLSSLSLYWNELSDISPLAGLTKLTWLNLSMNMVTDLTPLAGLTKLTFLSLHDNQIRDIRALAGLKELTSLSLTNGYAYARDFAYMNRITDISVLTEMTKLRELALNDNPLPAKVCAVDIPLIRANNPGVVISYDACRQVWTLNVSSTPGGSVVSPGSGNFLYFAGELAPVEAVAEEAYQFTHWSGTAVDANAMLDPCAPHTSVTMDADYSLVAHFKPQEQPWNTVYFNDFEDQVGPEWSHNAVDATLVGARRFLGQFGNDAVTLALADLPPHTRVRLSFDLFALRSWDGNAEVWGQGPDHWALTVDGQTTLLDTNFCNHPYAIWHNVDDQARNATVWQTQAFPGNYPDQQHPPQTGAAEMQSLGYTHPGVALSQDSVYHLILTCEHDTSDMTVSFSASGLQALNDESWGLDNVRVEVVQDEIKTELAVSSTSGGSVVVPGEGTFAYDSGEMVVVEAAAEAGYHFTHWSGTAADAGKVADPGSASTTVVVDGDYTLVANFAVNQKTLTVSSGAGGSVTAPGEGSFQYPQGTSVPIQAAAKAHYYFTHWSGTAVDAGKVANPASANTTVTVDADYTLVANFRIDQHQLTVSAGAGGYIYVETRTGNVTTPWYDQPIPPLDHGTQVTVIATPYGGWKFTGWSGTMGSTESPFTFDLTQDCDLEALFVPE